MQEEIQRSQAVRELSECPDEPLIKTEELVQLQAAYNDESVSLEPSSESLSVHNKVGMY